MQRKRERLEIIYNILTVIMESRNSIRPTPLLRKTNLSTQRFSEYYNELLHKGFLREEEDRKGKKYISLTDKGFKYIEKYSYIVAFMDEFEL